MNKKDWIWMPHAAHFCCGSRCQFVLATYVGGYIVSTVGEMSSSIKGKEYETVSRGYLYETEVFKAKKQKLTCCPYGIILKGGYGVEQRKYNTPSAATKGHMELCEKWSKEKENK